MAVNDEAFYAIGRLRFNANIDAWNFKPSIGIVAKDLMLFASNIKSFRIPLERSIQRVIIPSIRKNFKVGGRPPWDDLAEGTIKARLRKGYGAWPFLVRTGNLRRAATSFDIWSVTSTSATVKDLPGNVWYGKVHQAGITGRGAAGKWFAPYKSRARSILGIHASDKEVTKLGFQIFDRRVATHGPPPKPEPTIPARPFIVFQEEDIPKIQAVFYQWLDERILRDAKFKRVT